LKYGKVIAQKATECSDDGCCCSSISTTKEIGSAENEFACASEPDRGSDGAALVQNKTSQQAIIFQVEGITCMDCAQKFEKAVNELPGVVKATLNTMTGKLTVEGVANLEAIRRLGQDENYTINQVTTAQPNAVTVFQVDGITCMDCAQKFKKAVNNLPGVITASLNTMTGKLTVKGTANLQAIQALGREEDYTVTLAAPSAANKVTVLNVEGITCMDCAQKFEKAVNGLPGVSKATLNTMTGKLTVEGETDLKAIQELGREEDYTISMASVPVSSNVTVFKVDGITCMDCAQKFEKAVNSLSGVNNATLNTMTGKLVVEGKADLKAIQGLGKEENYTINFEDDFTYDHTATPKHQAQKADWELRRAVLSGIALAVGYAVEKFSGFSMVFLPLYIVAMVLGGWGNFRKAARALPRGNFNMSVLMSVAVIGALAIGQYEEGASVAFLYAISEMLEAWTMEKARRSIRDLMDIAPKVARVRRGGSETEMPVEDIIIGDVMIIRPGEKIAMDGVILKGESAINQAAITGESIPVEKGPGAEVFAGTLNTHGSLEIEVTKLVQDTTIAKIIHMVEDAQGKRAPSQAFVEKFAAMYTPIVLALAVSIVFIPPLFFGQPWAPWIYRGLALLVVACPCALVVSTPVAIVSAISNAAKNGVLIKGGIYLEEAGALSAIAFDKTGTLTKGQPAVTDIVPLAVSSEDILLKISASLEARSEHPLAVAIVKAAEDRHLAVVPAEDFSAITGRGAQGTVDEETVYIGNPRLFTELGVSLEPIAKQVEQLQGEGKTAMIVGTKAKFLGIVAVADEVREASAKTIAALKQAGIHHTIMLTGDNTATARAMAQTVGVDDFRAELLPQDKVTAIEGLIKEYGKVAMIGDGINDAPALALSTVGIAMGGAGTDTALETADIALMADDLTKLPFTIRLSKKTLGIIRQNITFSLAIKAVAILAVFPGWLTLWLAILADMGASIIVTLNSLRLLQVKVKE